MVRETLIKTVSDGLKILLFRLEGRSAAGLYDLNIVSEDFFKDFLNILRDLALENLNQGGKSQPAIDLGDKRRRLSFQITTEHTARKIQDSLDKFCTHKLDHEYTELSFVVLRRKQSNYPFFNSGTLQFNPKQHILDIDDLIREAAAADTDRLQRLAALIVQEGLLPDPGLRGVLPVIVTTITAVFCCTTVWLTHGFQWNNPKNVAMVVLLLIGLVALFMVYSLSKTDRKKALIWVVFCISASVGIVVLSVQEFLQGMVRDTPGKALRAATPQSPKVTDLQSLTGASNSIKSDTGATLVESSTNKLDVTLNNRAQRDQSDAVLERTDNRIWIVPDITIHKGPGELFWTETAGAPPEIRPDGQTWAIRAYHLARPSDRREWYIDGPWTYSPPGGHGAYLTNSLISIPAGGLVFDGTLYSVRTTNTFKLPLWRPQTAPSSSSADVQPGLHPVGPWLDSSQPHSILDFVKAFQSTNN